MTPPHDPHDPADPANAPRPSPLRRYGPTVVRWLIAVVGIWIVVVNITLRDQVYVLDADNVPQRRVYLAGSREAGSFTYRDPATAQPVRVDADQVVNQPDRKTVNWTGPYGAVHPAVPLLGMRLAGELNRSPDVTELLIRDPATGEGRWVDPATVDRNPADPQRGGFALKVPYPAVEIGLISLVRRANPWLLLAALAVFPITYVMGALRWHGLLGGLGIALTRSRALVLTMVGGFYNSFMLGSTGGDVIKAFYLCRLTPRRTPAVMSVLVDRAIGLITLVLMGGAMAGLQWLLSADKADPTAVACAQVAAATFALTAGLVVGTLFVTTPDLRRRSGFDGLIDRLPVRHKVYNVLGVMEQYRRQPGLVAWAILMTVPVHTAVILSALLAGKAFGLPISTPFYFVCVPVIVLVGALPISPQGAGVMEFFAILLTRRQGATVGQAVALTMSIRLVQIGWNLVCGIAVFRGGYGQPPAAEVEEIAEEEPLAGGAVAA